LPNNTFSWGLGQKGVALSYNLLDEQWIPVLWNSGGYTMAGIREVLAQAHRIREVAASNPIDRVAVIRFLLALLYWCRGNPPSDVHVGAVAPLPDGWFARLDDARDRFELLGDDRRFYQHRRAGDKRLSANYLIHEVPTGTNFHHFRHATDGKDGLCLACCAMGLLRLPAFTTQGGQGKSPGINAAPPIYVIPVGRSLAETILLSWRRVADIGQPAWEQPDLALPAQGPVSLLTGLTWLPRRVWLDDPGTPEGTCSSCGTAGPLVRHTVFAGVGSTKQDVDAPGRVWADPHVIYEQAKRRVMSVRAGNTLGNANEWTLQWARIAAGSKRLTMGVDSRVWVVGFSTDQNKYIETTEILLQPTGSPTEGSLDVLRDWRRASLSLEWKVKAPGDSPSRKHPEISAAFASVRPNAERTVAAKVIEFTDGGDAAWQTAVQQYQPAMRAVARSLAPGYTVAAWRSRRRIEGALPDIPMQAKLTPGPAGKKRGGDDRQPN
jgi:hypothetical protein